LNDLGFCLRIDFDGKGGSFSIDAINTDLSSHLLDHPLANAQAQAGSLSIHLGVFVQFSKLHEKFIQVFFFNAHSRIDDLDLELNKNKVLLWLLHGLANMRLHVDDRLFDDLIPERFV
jgi:hypothetical protein